MSDPSKPDQPKCKCGHSVGAHNRGSLALGARGSNWNCLASGCDCLIFETVDQWASRMAQVCPHCDGTGRTKSPWPA